MIDEGFFQVPIGVSARHVHLCQGDALKLFGRDITMDRPLTQPGEFAANERVTLCTNHGSIPDVRVLGPCRRHTQVELAKTDCYTLGIPGVIRLSGNIDGTPGLTLVGPNGSILLEKGAIVASRHLHVPSMTARRYNLEKGQLVRAFITSKRGGTLDEIIVRPGDQMKLELHLDTDEANALDVKTGDHAKIIKPTVNSFSFNHSYVCVDDILELIRCNQQLHLKNDQKLTPAARELALKHNLLK